MTFMTAKPSCAIMGSAQTSPVNVGPKRILSLPSACEFRTIVIGIVTENANSFWTRPLKTIFDELGGGVQSGDRQPGRAARVDFIRTPQIFRTVSPLTVYLTFGMLVRTG